MAEALSTIRDTFGTDRCVFVGTDETSEAVETVSGWTCRSTADAAAAADWKLVTAPTEDRN